MPEPRRYPPMDPTPIAPPVDPQSPWVQLRTGSTHPLLFSKMIAAADKTARPGDIVTVYDKAGALFGRGLYNPRSKIVLRMLAHGDVTLDDNFFRARLAQAVELRRRLNLDAVSDAYRLVHAEGDALSGLIVERYADHLVFEVFSLGMFRRVPLFAQQLSELLGPPTSLDRPGRAAETWQTVVRADASIEQAEGFRITPTANPPASALTIREHGVRYRVDVREGHKTGFFCDQRDNRKRFAGFCKDADVLDLCCYTGAFSLCAKVLGGAKDVTAVDLDENAVALARENANLNQARITLVHADAFAYTRQLTANGRLFDCVVLDPPKLAGSRLELEEALGKYYDLNVFAMRTVRPGGIFLTCSCSGLVSREEFIGVIHRAARRNNRPVQLFDQQGPSPDHPIMLDCPESSYLKALWCRL